MCGLLVSLVCASVNFLLAFQLNAVIDERNAIEVKEKVGLGIGNNNQDCKKLRQTNEAYDKVYSR